MTLQGKKNHFNLKFLKGYGHSISVKDSKIMLKDGHHLSTEAISLFKPEQNQCHTDTYGNPQSFINSMMVSNTAIQHRMAQYDTFRDPDKVLKLQSGF